jgi:hypothetical protein
MGVYNPELFGRFSAYARRIKRNNPDRYRTQATAERTLGFTGIIDISGILTNSQAELSVKLNGEAWQTRSVNFSGVSPAALTPLAAATALNAAGFTGVTFGVDDDTQRLRLSANTVEMVVIPQHPEIVLFKTEVQIKSVLAGVLDFGQCRRNGGLGCYWAKDFDDHDISYGFAYDRKEAENIDMEGEMGTLTRMTIPGNILGMTFALATKFKDDELTGMIQGGNIIPGTATTPSFYIVPSSEDTDSPTFTTEIFLPLYGQGTSTIDQIAAIERRIFPSCSGTEGDVPAEAKSWASFSYNISASEPKDINGKKSPSLLVPQYTWDQYDALKVEDI